MKKWRILFLLQAMFFCVSCSEATIPVFADAESFAASLYSRAGLDKNGLYCEEMDESLAFVFGLNKEEFDQWVDHALCYRQMVDEKGQTLYLFETEDGQDSATFAKKIYEGYEFAPCDPSEKMAVVCSGKYVMLFKSTQAEVDAAVDGFRSLSGGALRFKKDQDHLR